MKPVSNPTVLALDAAGAACSAALWRDGAVAARRWAGMERGHAEALMPMAVEVVGEAGFEALDAVCVTVGPGAYTGLRVAIAAARGLALALDVPAVGVDSFEVHALAAANSGCEETLAVVLETKRQDFYFRLGRGDAEVLSAHAIAERLPPLAASLCLAGDAPRRLLADAAFAGQDWPVIDTAGDAAIAACIAAAQIAGGNAPDTPPRPRYLRPPDASPPSADRQRLRSAG
jgi:tRNA threonylcarbamoyladenosine biosynthesis protein TsaB